MCKSPSEKEKIIQNRFNWLIKKALHGEAVDYFRHMDYRREHEIMLSEMSEKEMAELCAEDEYDLADQWFQVLGYDVKVKDLLLAEAIQALSAKKRDVVLLSYFLDMSDAEIARHLNLVRSTVGEHRKRSLELMKKMMEEHRNEKKR